MSIVKLVSDSDGFLQICSLLPHQAVVILYVCRPSPVHLAVIELGKDRKLSSDKWCQSVPTPSLRDLGKRGTEMAGAGDTFSQKPWKMVGGSDECGPGRKEFFVICLGNYLTRWLMQWLTKKETLFI